MEMTIYTSGDSIGGDIAAYSEWASGATRSLELLRAIEQTVTALQSTSDVMRSIHRAMSDFLKGLPDVKEPVPEDGVLPALEGCQEAIEKVHGYMKAKKAAADKDTKLRPSDGVSEAYSSAMGSLCDAHDAIESLRWHIMDHNAALDKSGDNKVLSSPEDIEQYLRAL